MKLKMLSVCAALTTLFITWNVFAAEKQKSIVHKVVGGGAGYQFVQTPDGGYAFVDGTNVTQINKVSAAKISRISFSFDVPVGGFVFLNRMVPTSNGYILFGAAQLNGYYGSYTAMVVKAHPNGVVEWGRTFMFGGSSSFDSAVPTTDGGLIVTGSYFVQDSHPILVKFSAQGDILWSKSFESLSGSFQSIPSGDGGILLTANIFNTDFESIGVNLIKIDSAGNIVWAKTLKKKSFSIESMTSLVDQSYLLAGKGANSKVLLLIRLNADGTFRSKSAYSLNAPNFVVTTVGQTPDGGLAIGGTLYKKSGLYYDGFLLKIDDHQKLVFQKRLGFHAILEGISSVIAKEDGSYLVFGSTKTGPEQSYTDTLLVTLNSDGSVSGCNFSHNLRVSKVRFGTLKRQDLSIVASGLPIPPPGSIRITTERLQLPVSDACQ